MFWKDVIGWEKYYEINEIGQVRNKETQHIISQDTNSCGYKRVTLYRPRKRFFVHRLVALMFIPNPSNKPEINHKDNNLQNNNYKNLEWTTRKANERQSHLSGKKAVRPFWIVLENNTIKRFLCVGDLIECLEINVTFNCVRHWINHKNLGYKKYGIKKFFE